MRYFRVEDSFDISDRWYLNDPRTKDGRVLDPRLFTEGKAYRGYAKYPEARKDDAAMVSSKDFADELPIETLVQTGATPLDFTLGSFEMPILRKRTADCIRGYCGDSIQWIPSSVLGSDGDFEILNALKVVNAIDEGCSEITWWTKKDGHPLPERIGNYAGIGRLVLSGNCIKGAMIFRLTNWELPLIVCELVKDILEDIDTSGIAFKELAVT